MAEILVCNGATCQCSAGDAPATLTVSMQSIVKVNGQLVATQSDCQYPTNIPGFGTCSILTAESGTGANVPCVPAVARWTGASSKFKMNGLAALLDGSTLTCSEGGQISITNPNNTKVNSAY